MLELPTTTYFGKIIAKDKIYEQVGADKSLRDLFVAQVERIRWLYKISQETTSIAKGDSVSEIQFIEVSLNVEKPDNRILTAILKAVPYKIVFVLVFNKCESYEIFYDSKIHFSSSNPPKLSGTNMNAAWDNIVVQVGGVETVDGRTLDEQIAFDQEQLRLKEKIAKLETQARKEKQPRRKWNLHEEIKKLKLQQLNGSSDNA